MPTAWRVLELSAPVALLLCLLLLWAFMRAVRRSMRRVASATPQAASAVPAEPVQRSATEPPAHALGIVTIGEPDAAAVRAVWRDPIRSIAVQVAAGLAFAVGLTMAWATQIEGAVGWGGYALSILSGLWPTVIVIGLMATAPWRTMALLALAYAAVLAGAVMALGDGTPTSLLAVARAWWQGPGLATVFVLAFMARPIRAMGPLLVVLTMAAWTGVFAINEVFDRSAVLPKIVEALPEISSPALVNLTVVALALALWGIPAVLAGLACYLLLRGLARLYRARWFSDQQLQIDAVWLIFALSYGWSHLPLGGALAFMACKLVSLAGCRLLRSSHGSAAEASRLLLLRVFSLGARSSRLFDAFSRLWRHQGPVRLIAGPDLANSTVEPHEFLDFMAGRLDRRFISGPEMLEQRLAEAEARCDPDNRFRVTGFFCHDDTWRMVLRRLARDSDLVLMDLRGFTRQSRGCVYEINELLDAVPLGNVLLLVDETTDMAVLHDVLRQGWSGIGAASINRLDPTPCVQLYTLARAPGIGRVVATLTAMRDPKGSAAAA